MKFWGELVVRMKNYMMFLWLRVAVIGPCIDKSPFDETDPNLYIIGQRINLDSPGNKEKLR